MASDEEKTAVNEANNEAAEAAKPSAEAAEPSAEAAKPEADAAVSKVDLKLSAAVNRVLAAVSAAVTTVTSLLSPLTSLASKCAGQIASLPWACMAVCAVTNGSQLLAAAAWFNLTANQLAFVLPVFSVVLPALLVRFGAALPESVRGFSGDIVMVGEKAVGLMILSNTVLI